MASSIISSFVDTSLIDDPQNLTVQFLSRCLLHATETSDYMACLSALTIISNPIEYSHRYMFSYRQQHTTPDDFFVRVRMGLQVPNDPANADGQLFRPFSKLLAAIVRTTPRVSISDQCGGVDLLVQLANLAGWNFSTADGEFLNAIFQCLPLFQCLLRDVEMWPKGEVKDSTWRYPDEYDMLLAVQRFVIACANRALEASGPEPGEVLVKTCCKAGFYEYLEEVLVTRGNKFPELYCEWSRMLT